MNNPQSFSVQIERKCTNTVVHLFYPGGQTICSVEDWPCRCGQTHALEQVVVLRQNEDQARVRFVFRPHGDFCTPNMNEERNIELPGCHTPELTFEKKAGQVMSTTLITTLDPTFYAQPRVVDKKVKTEDEPIFWTVKHPVECCANASGLPERDGGRKFNFQDWTWSKNMDRPKLLRSAAVKVNEITENFD